MKVTYEEAKKKAQGIDPKVDSYFEYPDAYIFFNSKAKGHDAEDNEIVIQKEGGNITNYAEYIMDSKYGSEEVQIKLVV